MLEIDASFGEGGGQIVRTAAALSALTGQSVRLSRIRQGRPRPGLAAQHVKAIQMLAEICKAKTRGLAVGSGDVEFQPGPVRGGRYHADIGTAGSVTLLIQCLLPALSSADGPVEISVRGGTDVQWSPTFDYLRNVALPAFCSFGLSASVELITRGYYPRGGGHVLLKVKPSGICAADLSRIDGDVLGISHSSGLPQHVSSRQASAAVKHLEAAGRKALVSCDVQSGQSTGSGITLWCGWKGASALGARGLPAEDVGRQAAEELLQELSSSAAVDVRLADQLVPYLAVGGGSFSVREISSHTRTNLWTVCQFLEHEVRVEQRDGLSLISAPGL
ncbi:MAG: RNA 3'-terminal-phosphate cyclase [Methanosaeta sp. PtaB.Bin039]|nr:MAG: RNA 3'-terminal-phosphate cyclase [Methanosaeta sp. PtaB.Bin039]OPY46773.1 MAG: RNA 3'-terminal-phosphate cyclase [Methanosaeta sp. PtaU1.Bin028]HOT07101.1 RNA 3'-terminal phosphate cyclase [Methanotrichaceae archaeon]HQF17046.1 RNA 3'-terminal phosphate cyclase [Methanotrichaceae archaeon]HQI91666.1 RNA 3'-terminal phosphate cyclase [Methanotrichaceae archaeon]